MQKMVELFFEKANWEDLSSKHALLEQQGIKTILLPPDKRLVNTHLLVSEEDFERAKNILRDEIKRTKPVVLFTLTNQPGELANLTNKIKVNLNYLFAVPLDDGKSVLVVSSEDNDALISSLK